MSKGKVKEYNPNRGYGVIVDSDSGRSLPVYANYMNLKAGQILLQGQNVEFDIENTRSEQWAINIKILSN